MSLSNWEADRIARRMLADYEVHRPNEIFAERGTDWLTLDDAYAVQHAVAELRRARGDHCVGYKVGCLSAAIQKQLGLNQPVRGYLWENEALTSGFHLTYEPTGSPQRRRFVNLAIEGEIALRLRCDIKKTSVRDENISDCVEGWFPVIELHNNIFRGPKPTSQELVAGNAMHAGFVAPPLPGNPSLAVLADAEIRVELDGVLAEVRAVSEIPDGPLGSLRWLWASLALTKESLKAGDIVLTGSPGRLIRVSGSCSIVVKCEGQRVELTVDQTPVGKGA